MSITSSRFTSPIEEPQFPLQTPPRCGCGHPSVLEPVNNRNLNGNIGRSYYHCIDNCHGKSQFISWNDRQGIVDGNPRCYCRYTSRIGRQNITGKEWFHCPIGQCTFKEDVSDGYEASSRDGAAGPTVRTIHNSQDASNGHAASRRERVARSSRHAIQSFHGSQGYGARMGGSEDNAALDKQARRENCCGCSVM